MSHLSLLITCVMAAAVLLGSSRAATAAVLEAPTTLAIDQLDPAAFTAWVDGMETPIADVRPDRLVWTDKSRPTHAALAFGRSTRPGVRHLRIGLKKPIRIGSVLVRGGGTLSYLAAGAVYPGKLDDEAAWTPALRMGDSGAVRDGVPADEYAIWTLPPNTDVQALRFTHTAAVTDSDYAGSLGGVCLLADRFANLAPQAAVAASAHSENANAVNDAKASFERWQSADDENRPAVSAEHPEWLLLTWPTPVTVGALNALSAGFASAELQWYAGPSDRHPRDAAEGDWKQVGTYIELQNGYACQLWPNLMRFAQPVTTRAIRVRLTSPTSENHPHLRGKTKQGRNVWIGELMVLKPLGSGSLDEAVSAKSSIDAAKPPIAVKFKLDRPGHVTLVIEGEKGVRVRNLVSETSFPAGENIAWWDATDDLGRDLDAARHGLYRIPPRPVAPGRYRVRGLVRDAIEPRYEFSVYATGTPPWETADTSGGWLTNHSPPQAALFLPADKAPGGEALMYLGSYVSEGGAGLAWVGLDGRKRGGRGWVGGVWTGAPFLARDDGLKAIAGNYAYVGSVWMAGNKSRGELRVTALTAKGDKTAPVHNFPVDPKKSITDAITGLAVRDGVVIASLPSVNQLVFIDFAAGKVLGTVAVEDPRGLAFDSQGRLLVVTKNTLIRYAAAGRPADLEAPQTLVSNLEDGQQVALDGEGNFYVSDLGNSHQVKVFNPTGQLLRSIGKPGAPAVGPYDPLHLNTPAGLAIDSQNRLWVTERDYLPKRVSLWSLDGKLLQAFYGPGKYGGGGSLDRKDKSRFYYADEERGTLEFKLDWDKGTSVVSRVLYRESPGAMKLAERAAAPEVPLDHNGRRYFANVYNSHPTGGSNTGFLFIERDGIAKPVAAIGRANDWDVLKDETFRSRWPAGLDLRQNPYVHDGKNQAIFAWSDLNSDAQAQPDEVTLQQTPDVSGVTIGDDLVWSIARVNGKAVRYAPTSVTSAGVPAYDLARAQTVVEGVEKPASSGGNQLLSTGPSGWSAITLGVRPFAPHGLTGFKDGQPLWSYPSLWPGLHAAHEAPKPERPGELIGTTRLLGPPMTNAHVGPLFAVNGNMGNVYLLTLDGLFVATLFKDKRMGNTWSMPAAERNMLLTDVTLHEENFWPTITQTDDGEVYIVDGMRMALIRLDGLGSLRPIPARDLNVTADDLAAAQQYRLAVEAQRQKDTGRGVLTAAIRKGAPTVDGKLDDWATAKFVEIDKSGTAAYFNSDTKPYDIRGAIAIAGDRLFAAYRTGDAKLLANSGDVPSAPFKTGGGLDLMLGTQGSAPATRSSPVEGDLRLLVTQANGKTLAVLYRAVVAGTKTPVPFSSPWRTITLDRVVDISDQVQLAGADGNYEISVPLAVLGIKVSAGQAIQGDIGILRGNGFQTMSRVYWSNKSAGITSDVPSEAMLYPQLWGRIEFRED